MKILHLASEYPPQAVYGLGRFVRDLAEEQVKQGHEVMVITNSMSGNYHDTMRGGVRILRVDLPPPKPPTPNSCIMIFNILLMQRALDLSCETLCEFDVVCSHDWITAPAAQAIREVFGPAHISTFHDTIIGKRLGEIQSQSDHFIAQVEKWTVAHADHVIANSRATMEELIGRYAGDQQKISIVDCAVAPETFQISDDNRRLEDLRQALFGEDKLILYVGRLDQEKGVDILLEAFAKLSGNVRLCLAGSGTLEDILKQRACDLGLEKRAKFVGYVENPVLAYLYSTADILICPSLYEPFGMVALEGMLHGTPAIVSDTGGLRDIVQDKENGLKVPAGDIEVLANAIKLLLEDSELRNQLGEKARSSILEKRTWPIACQKTTVAYEKTSKNQKHQENKTSDSFFLAADLEGEGYATGHKSRIIKKKYPKSSAITTGNDLLDIDIINKYDEKCLGAFNMAAKLFKHNFKPPEQIIARHWDGLLASTVFATFSPDIIYHSPSIEDQNEKPSEIEIFDYCIRLWAAEQAGRVLVEDVHSQSIFLQKKIRSEIETNSPINTDLPMAYPKTFRKSFAQDHEKIIVVASRLDAIDQKSFLILVQECVRVGLPFRWVLCGEGLIYEDLKKLMAKTPVLFTGYLSELMLNSLLSVSDMVVLPLEKFCDTRLLTQARSFDLFALAPIAENSNIQRWPKFHQVDFSSPEMVLKKIAQLFHLPELSRKTTPEQIVLYNDWGIGDELLLSAVAREIKRVHPDKQIWIRSRFGFAFPPFCESQQVPESAVKMETIYQNPPLYNPVHHSPFPGHLVQQMLDKVALDTGIMVQAQDIRPELKIKSAEREQKTILVNAKPNPRLPSKDWGIENWRKLCHLLHKERYKIIQTGAKEEPELPYAEDYRGQNIDNLPEICSSVSAIVCVTGLFMHLAAATQTPAIVIYGGREHPALDGYPDQIHLRGKPLACSGRWGCHLAPDIDCPNNMECMTDITPEIVEFFIAKLVEKS